MTLTINTETIGKLRPCKDRFDNWKYFYEHREFTITEFSQLEHISHSDKVWVILQLTPRFIAKAFVKDCVLAVEQIYNLKNNLSGFVHNARNLAEMAIDANTKNTVINYAIHVAYIAINAHERAGITNIDNTESTRQLEVLKHLIETFNEKETV